MKKFLISAAAAIVASTTVFAGAASAAPPAFAAQKRDDHRDFRNGSYVVNGHRYERTRGPAWQAPRGYHAQQWKRGDRLPGEYRRTAIRDYRSYHLAPPPRGYEYVRVGNDVVLTAIASGIIGAVIGNVFFN